MSNFLLVLVKDLNYFSESQLGENIIYDKKATKFIDLISFCKDITESLLIKLNKHHLINLHFIIDENISEIIFTDEWKLKQILINLLSNAVKFTFYGEITLEVKLIKNNEKDVIRFCVKDTGIGIKEEHKSNMFKPFSKGNLGNSNDLVKMGSGLGLTIVNEISKKIGEQIQYTSLYEIGTTFWFSIPYEIKSNSEINYFESIIHDINHSSNERNLKINEIKLQNDSIEKSKCNFSHSRSYETEKVDFKPKKIENYNGSLFSNEGEISNFEPYLNTEILLKNSNCVVNSSEPGPDKLKIIPLIKSNKNTENNFTILDFISGNIDSLRKIQNKNHSNDYIQILNKKMSSSTINANFFNMLLVEDEPFIRQSSIRIINLVSKKIGIKINIIEAEDGVEALYLIYKCFTQGIKVSLILSDENMNFMKGTRSSELISEFLEYKNMKSIPFYLVTAYDTILNENHINSTVKKILPKPLTQEVVLNLINESLLKK